MSMNIGFRYGALGSTLAEQANSQGYVLDNAETFEKSRKAITWLGFQDILTNSQIDKAYQRLHKNVVENLRLKGDAE